MMVYSVPLNSILRNVKLSEFSIKTEGTYPIYSKWFSSKLDNFTDSIMMLESSYESDTSLIDSAMNVYRGTIEFNPAKSLIKHFIENQEFTGVTSYTRYWHGYLVLLKPLLFIVDYGKIRMINGLVQIITVLLICIVMIKKELKEYIISFLLMYLMLMPLVLIKSIQFSTCFYVFLWGIMAILLIDKSELERFIEIVFLVLRIMTSYVDLLTYPITTFGIPMAFYLLVNKNDSVEKKLMDMVVLGFYWCIGFGGMWISKWLIACVTAGYNIFDATSQMSYWSSAKQESLFPTISVGLSNYQAFLKTPFSILTLVILIILIKKKTKLNGRLNNRKNLLPFLLLSLAPAVWYAFAKGHSDVHYWFTNKACSVSFISLLFAFFSL